MLALFPENLEIPGIEPPTMPPGRGVYIPKIRGLAARPRVVSGTSEMVNEEDGACMPGIGGALGRRKEGFGRCW